MSAYVGTEPCRTTMPRDLVVTGIHSITNMGDGNVRITFFVDVDGEQLVLDRALVIQAKWIPDGIGKAMMAIGRRIFATPDGALTVMQ